MTHTAKTPTTCGACGADATHIGWDPADGFTCNACGACDSDERTPIPEPARRV